MHGKTARKVVNDHVIIDVLESGPEWSILYTAGAHTAILRKVVGKYVHATIPKGNMGYDQYTVLDTAAVEPTFVAFL